MTSPAQNRYRFMDPDAIEKMIRSERPIVQDLAPDPGFDRQQILFLQYRSELRSQWYKAATWIFNELMGISRSALPHGERIGVDMRRFYQASMPLTGFQVVLGELSRAIHAQRVQGTIDEQDATCIRWSHELRRVLASMPDEEAPIIYFGLESRNHSREASRLKEHVLAVRTSLKELLALVILARFNLAMAASSRY